MRNWFMLEASVSMSQADEELCFEGALDDLCAFCFRGGVVFALELLGGVSLS